MRAPSSSGRVVVVVVGALHKRIRRFSVQLGLSVERATLVFTFCPAHLNLTYGSDLPVSKSCAGGGGAARGLSRRLSRVGQVQS